MKTIAFYLPQFHEIEENNRWWGPGFTEWTGVKNSQPIFPFHKQPKEPNRQFFYNLLEKETMIWQNQIAKKAHVDVFCFYHYWFEGKQLLEKPAENLLEWKDIPQEFCFSWANETWKRTWSKYAGNDWNEVGDSKEAPQKDSGILMEQTYGTTEQWKEHFMYLLNFFQDDRYLKKDGKPVFLIYKPQNIHCLTSMLEYWNLLAKENGFPGIFVIGTNEEMRTCSDVNAWVTYEPGYTLDHEKPEFYKKRDRYIKKIRETGMKLPNIYSYDIFWNKILNREIKSRKQVYYGGFIDFDNTPRRGKNATLFRGVRGKKFKKYYEGLYEKNREKGNEYIFLTAWNEWGEGACLEPDTFYGYTFLDQIRKVNQNKENKRAK